MHTHIQGNASTSIEVNMMFWSPVANTAHVHACLEGVRTAITKRPSWSPQGGCEGFKFHAKMMVGLHTRYLSLSRSLSLALSLARSLALALSLARSLALALARALSLYVCIHTQVYMN